MKKLANPLFIGALCIFLLSACNFAKNGTQQSTATQAAGLANPASVYCTEHGGKSQITTNPNGGQSGVCVFVDGSQCDEWEFFRGACKAGASASIASTFPKYDPAQLSCANFKPTGEIENADGKVINWQPEALAGTKHTIASNGTITVGLRNKFGSDKDTFDYQVTVMTPDSTFASAEGTVTSDTFSEKTYPNDFQLGTSQSKGTYTVAFEVNEQLVACTGFVVQ